MGDVIRTNFGRALQREPRPDRERQREEALDAIGRVIAGLQSGESLLVEVEENGVYTMTKKHRPPEGT